MPSRCFRALVLVAGAAVIAGLLGGSPVGWTAPAFGVQQVAAQTAPAPSTPNTPGGPSYVPGPGYGPGYGPGFGPGPYGRGRRGFGVRAGLFALGALLRFLFLIALIVIAWKVIMLRTLWGRPDGAVQVVRERFARGEISEEEFRKRLAALS